MILALIAPSLLLGMLQGSEQRSSPAAMDRAASILDRHVAVTGGREAYAKLDYRTSRGTVLYDSMDVICTLTIHETRSTDRHWQSRSEMLGDQREGSTGEISWAHSDMSGTWLRRGAARARALREAPIDAPARWRDLFERVEYDGTREVDGKSLYAVTLVPAEGRPETRHYDAQTGLHVQTDCHVELEGNSVVALITYSDYRSVDGLLLPHSIRRKSADVQELVIHLDHVVHEKELPASTFEPPAPVRALLD